MEQQNGNTETEWRGASTLMRGLGVINELEEILEALATNTSNSNKRMAQSGLGLIDIIKRKRNNEKKYT